MKVLFVEDELFVREMAVAGLEDAGFEVIEAASGGEALRLLHAGIAVDALLTDVRLPEANVGWWPGLIASASQICLSCM
jgi:CheY-like chemotaxis protein